MSIKKILERYVTNADANILVYSGGITRDGADKYIQLARGLSQKPNLLLALTTYGGDPSAAYRIASFNRRRYKKVTLLVPGYCKSAGTLVAFGADEIVMSAYGEFGPLDMQIVRQDDLLHYGSGLDVTQALTIVTALTSTAFGHFFKAILDRGEGALSTTTAADIASKLSVGLYSPIVAQVNPLHLGETTRVNTTATAYARRLRPADGEQIVRRLIHEYPSHGYCIDVDEAKEIFDSVREPEKGDESIVFAYMEQFLRAPAGTLFVEDLTAMMGEEEDEQQEDELVEPEPRRSANGEADRVDPAGNTEEVRNDDPARRGKTGRRRSKVA